MAPENIFKRIHLCHVGLRFGGGLVFALAALSALVQAWAEETEVQLRTNPFVRPPLIASTPEPTRASGPIRSMAPPSHLRFALAAGPDSLVNVDGRTLRIGDELNGYRLEAVKTDTAIFSNGEEVIELRMRRKDIRKDR